MSLDEILAWIPPGHPDEALARQVQFDRLPAHVAIIMDGNGRWAAQRHLPRVEGHRAGIDAVRDTVETAARLGIKVLTLYAFSVENWKRPASEVGTLMLLLKRYLRSELNTLLGNDIRFRVIGRIDELSPDIQRGTGSRRSSAPPAARGMLFNIALNYGGRAEIVDAARRAMASGVRPEELDEATFASFLYTAGQPDPDLMIRTSGEMRVSNYLLWQIAYSEIYVTDTLWPDFRRRHLLEAVLAYQKRERRYGGIPTPEAIGVEADAPMVRLVSGVVMAAVALAAMVWLPHAGLPRWPSASWPAAAAFEYAALAGRRARPGPMGGRGAGRAVGVGVRGRAGLGRGARPGRAGCGRGRRARTGPLDSVSLAAIFGIVYLGIPLGLLASLRGDQRLARDLLLVATVVVSDSLQYYTGRLLGRRPLAPRVSPKKTIEGAVGGVVAAALFLAGVGPLFLPGASRLRPGRARARGRRCSASAATCSSRS